jgi:hypothetical protein
VAPDLHPGLSTRDRITLQTSPVSCQVCHAAINPLGFALEEYDSIGRRRSADGLAPVDAAGSYLPRGGAAVSFVGGKELSAFVATSRDTEEAFLQALFHAEVIRELLAGADLFVHNVRRGPIARLGLAPADVLAINPSIVYCTACGFQEGSPLAHAPAIDDSIQVASGLAALNAEQIQRITRQSETARFLIYDSATANPFTRQGAGAGRP